MATVTMSQSIVVVDENETDVNAEAVGRSFSCGAYLRGIPPALAVLAEVESWTLPHVFTETWEEEIP